MTSGFCVPKIIKIGLFLTERWRFFWSTLYMWQLSSIKLQQNTITRQYCNMCRRIYDDDDDDSDKDNINYL